MYSSEYLFILKYILFCCGAIIIIVALLLDGFMLRFAYRTCWMADVVVMKIITVMYNCIFV